MPRPSRNVDLPGCDAVILLNHDMLELRLSHPWCLSVGEAESLQTRFAGFVEKSDRLPRTICRVAGVDVAYESGADRLFAAVVTQDLQTLAVLEVGTQQDLACFPYIPSLFSFREIPPLARALAKLAHAPDLLICDGHGLAHPRRFGLACAWILRLAPSYRQPEPIRQANRLANYMRKGRGNAEFTEI